MQLTYQLVQVYPPGIPKKIKRVLTSLGFTTEPPSTIGCNEWTERMVLQGEENPLGYFCTVNLTSLGINWQEKSPKRLTQQITAAIQTWETQDAAD